MDRRTTAVIDATKDRSGASGSVGLAAVLLVTLVVRLLRVDQPLVENYVGRQVPTAMVARNLERGLGFLYPQLDTAPFPNYFPVEPPLYQVLVVGLRRASGGSLEASGRIVSAIATALAAWGLFGLVRRRENLGIALTSAMVFALLPVTIRYGRAFQPDALMLGGVVSGLHCWDMAGEGRRRAWLVPGWFLLALGFACKITSAVVLAPLYLAILRPPRSRMALLAASTLLPALAWYAWAGHLIATGGSRAAEGNRDIWFTVVGLSALANRETLAHIRRFFLLRSFTPLGPILAGWGLAVNGHRLGPPGLWQCWGLFTLATLAMLAGKLHHEYYWLVLSPVVAVGIARALAILRRHHRWLAVSVAIVLLGSSFVLTRSTWQTPAEWNGLEEAALQVRELVPAGALLVASEPLLYQAGVRGCRLEFTGPAAVRAASEWPGEGSTRVTDPLDLIEFYRLRGARFLADLAPASGDDRRKALHEAIRRRYKVQVDRAPVMIAELSPIETPGHVQ